MHFLFSLDLEQLEFPQTGAQSCIAQKVCLRLTEALGFAILFCIWRQHTCFFPLMCCLIHSLSSRSVHPHSPTQVFPSEVFPVSPHILLFWKTQAMVMSLDIFFPPSIHPTTAWWKHPNFYLKTTSPHSALKVMGWSPVNSRRTSGYDYGVIKQVTKSNEVWCWAEPNNKCLYRKKWGHKHTQKEDHTKTQGGDISSSQKVPEEINLAGTLVSDFQPPQLGEN